MDPFSALSDTVFHQGMELKHVQTVQSMHADRLLKLERKQADDAALKSVWTSPFPSVLTGTPNQGPVHTPSADVFDDFDDEHCQSLLTSLHLDEDPIPRRGASRANSVRFDVSAIQGSNWSHGSRPSNDFGPVRPNSAFGLGRSHSMERSMSHKSEGRHSSAGHSVHSAHSASGRTSSMGLNNHFSVGDEDDDSYVMPAPPPGLFVLGSVPTIIRCWLNENFSHSSLFYCVVCTGSQKSTISQDLLKDLGLLDQVQKDSSGVGGSYIRLPVYLPEAIVTQPTSRPCSPGPQLPTLTVTFDVLTSESTSKSSATDKKLIRIFIGSDTLRAHSADLLLSQNKMSLTGDDGNRLSVPFVRPEDESVFKNIVTGHVVPQKVSLKGTAAPFTPAEKRATSTPESQSYENEPTTPSGGTSSRGRSPTKSVDGAETSDTTPSTGTKTLKSPLDGAMRLAIDTKTAANGSHAERASAANDAKTKSLPTKSPTSAHPSTDSKDPTSAGASGIWSSWRSSAAPTSLAPDKTEETISTPTSTSGYKQPLSLSGRSVRSSGSGSGMKVLKPSKAVPTTSRSVSSGTGLGMGTLGNGRVGTGASYEPPLQSSPFDESMRKSGGPDTAGSAGSRWDNVRREKEGDGGGVGDGKEKEKAKKIRLISGGKTANPIGTASAFSWMKPASKPQE